MSNAFTGLLFGIGFSGWVYFMMMHRTGGNVKSSLILASIAGVVGFLVILSVLSMLFGGQE